MENINEVVVDKMEELATEATENIGKAVIETASTVPATPSFPTTVSQPATKGFGKDLAIGLGCTIGGAAIGAAIDHWVVPKVSEAWKNHKVKAEKRKAEKKAKKDAKAAAKAAKTGTKQPEATPAKTTDGTPAEAKVE